jgi:ketosteroid isomerase-like protein
MADGNVLRLTLCVVADLTGGRVTQVREYFDSAAAAPLVAALSKG